MRLYCTHLFADCGGQTGQTGGVVLTRGWSYDQPRQDFGMLGVWHEELRRDLLGQPIDRRVAHHSHDGRWAPPIQSLADWALVGEETSSECFVDDRYLRRSRTIL